MKYAVEIGSGVMIYIPSFIITFSVDGGGMHRHKGSKVIS
jgi:hypothetical protein